MTRYDFRMVARAVYGAAALLADFIWHLYMAHRLHAAGEDERAADEMERAAEAHGVICDAHRRFGGGRR